MGRFEDVMTFYGFMSGALCFALILKGIYPALKAWIKRELDWMEVDA